MMQRFDLPTRPILTSSAFLKNLELYSRVNVTCYVQEVGILKFEGPWIYRVILLNNDDGVTIGLVLWDDAAEEIGGTLRRQMILEIRNVLVMPYHHPTQINNGNVNMELLYESESTTIQVLNSWKNEVMNFFSSASGSDI